MPTSNRLLSWPDLLEVPSRLSKPLALPTLFVFQTADTHPDWGEIEHQVPELRRKHADSPFVLTLPQLTNGETFGVVRRASILGIRGILDNSSRDLVGLQLGVLREAPVVLDIKSLLDAAVSHSTVQGTASALGVSARTLRRRLQTAGVPRPKEWLRLVHGLRASAFIWSHADVPFVRTALELGYGDAPNLSRSLHQLFGMRPGAIRKTIGFEPLLFAWSKRAFRAVS